MIVHMVYLIIITAIIITTAGAKIFAPAVVF